MISAAQIHTACSLLGWTSLNLAMAAVIGLDEAEMALNDVQVGELGGLQLTAISEALQNAGIEFVALNGAGLHARLKRTSIL